MPKSNRVAQPETGEPDVSESRTQLVLLTSVEFLRSPTSVLRSDSFTDSVRPTLRGNDALVQNEQPAAPSPLRGVITTIMIILLVFIIVILMIESTRWKTEERPERRAHPAGDGAE